MQVLKLRTLAESILNVTAKWTLVSISHQHCLIAMQRQQSCHNMMSALVGHREIHTLPACKRLIEKFLSRNVQHLPGCIGGQAVYRHVGQLIHARLYKVTPRRASAFTWAERFPKDTRHRPAESAPPFVVDKPFDRAEELAECKETGNGED